MRSLPLHSLDLCFLSTPCLPFSSALLLLLEWYPVPSTDNHSALTGLGLSRIQVFRLRLAIRCTPSLSTRGLTALPPFQYFFLSLFLHDPSQLH